MATTWGVYRNQIRRSVLNDITMSQWTDEQVHDQVCWALDTFCAHTALPKEWVLDADTNALLPAPYDLDNDLIIQMPTDAYESIDFEGQVVIVSNGRDYYFDPLLRTDGLTPMSKPRTPFYFMWGDSQIELSKPIGATNKLIVRYFAYYPHPILTDDDSIISIPRWAEQPVAFLSGSYALASLAVQSANIDRWKDRTDSGNPEQNALRSMQEYLFKQYERGINRYPQQDRANWFRRHITDVEALW